MKIILILFYILPLTFLAICIYNFYLFIKNRRRKKTFPKVKHQVNDDKRFETQYVNESADWFGVPILPSGEKSPYIEKHRKRKAHRHLTYPILLLILLLIISVVYFYAPYDGVRGIKPKGDKGDIESLLKGKIAYYIPGSMKLEQNYRTTVSITQAQNDSILLEGIDKGIDNYEFRIKKIDISSRVTASLVDPTNINFDITPLSSEEQLVNDSTNTTWMWNIRPKKSGENVLILKVSIRIKHRFGETPKDILIFDKPFLVESSVTTEVKNFLNEHWQWFTTVLIIPLFLWLRNIYIMRKKNKRNKREPIGFKGSRA
jgi:hypothetical protein